jgi:hypothetical protein
VLSAATKIEITKRRYIEVSELDMRQRSATDIQTKSKRKRFSKPKSLLEPIQDGIFVSRIVKAD